MLYTDNMVKVQTILSKRRRVTDGIQGKQDLRQSDESIRRRKPGEEQV